MISMFFLRFSWISDYFLKDIYIYIFIDIVVVAHDSETIKSQCLCTRLWRYEKQWVSHVAENDVTTACTPSK